jgi:SAM-dependent methyltransferase
MEIEAYSEMRTIQERHWWFTGRRAILRRLLKGMNLPENATILEVGSGTGGNLGLLREFGSVVAFDMEPTAVDYCKLKFGNQIDIRVGSCPDDIPIKVDEKFDLICLLDVIEHIEKDNEALSVLKKYMKVDGKILVTVPAYSWLWSGHDEFVHHKRRYTKKGVCELANKLGLVVVDSSYFNSILFPLAVVVRVVNKIAGREGSKHTHIPPEPINRVFQMIFSSERFLIKKFRPPMGLSIWIELSNGY